MRRTEQKPLAGLCAGNIYLTSKEEEPIGYRQGFFAMGNFLFCLSTPYFCLYGRKIGKLAKLLGIMYTRKDLGPYVFHTTVILRQLLGIANRQNPDPWFKFLL
jgi:hypothetical protein